MADDLKRIVGKRLQAARVAADLTQEALASGTGRTPESISNIERGKQSPSIETLVLMARALTVPVEEFLRGLDGATPKSDSRTQMEAQLAGAARLLSEADLRIAVEQIGALARGRGRAA